MINEDLTNFYVGEVDSYSNTYDEKVSTFAINVKVKQNNNEKIIFNVKPANINYMQIPIKGENVLIFQGYSENTSYLRRERQWYYLQTIAIQSNVNNNILPIISPTFTQDSEFIDTSKSTLQPYKGDVLIQGRWGNTIRLGSTTKKSSTYSIQPKWIGDTETDPIITLSVNSKKATSNFSVEDINTDDASIYLTSKQQIPNLKLGNLNFKNSIKCYTPVESQYSNSQFIGIADRIILKAKTDIAVIDSPVAIVLNTTGEVKIGSDDADEQLVHGNVLLEIIFDLIQQLRTPIQCGTNVGTFLSSNNLKSIESKLKTLLSNKYYIKKT